MLRVTPSAPSKSSLGETGRGAGEEGSCAGAAGADPLAAASGKGCGNAAVTPPGGKREGSRCVASSVGPSSAAHRFGRGAAGGFAESLGWECTLAMGDSHRCCPRARRCRWVPLGAAMSPSLQGWHPQLRTLSIPPHGRSSGLTWPLQAEGWM